MSEKLEPAFLDLQSAEWISKDQYLLAPGAQRFKQWESNCEAKIGLGVAIDYALSWGMESIQKRMMSLSKNFRTQLGAISKVRIQDLGLKKCGIISFSLEVQKAGFIHKYLANQKINISVSMRRSLGSIWI